MSLQGCLKDLSQVKLAKRHYNIPVQLLDEIKMPETGEIDQVGSFFKRYESSL